MSSIFTITGTVLSVRLPKEIDHYSSEKIRKETDVLAQRRNIRTIYFDFSETEFMDSSGIGMIIGRYKMMKFMGGTVSAIQVSERMRRILMMSGIYKIIDIYEGMPQQSNLL